MCRDGAGCRRRGGLPRRVMRPSLRVSRQYHVGGDTRQTRRRRPRRPCSNRRRCFARIGRASRREASTRRSVRGLGPDSRSRHAHRLLSTRSPTTLLFCRANASAPVVPFHLHVPYRLPAPRAGHAWAIGVRCSPAKARPLGKATRQAGHAHRPVYGCRGALAVDGSESIPYRDRGPITPATSSMNAAPGPRVL